MIKKAQRKSTVQIGWQSDMGHRDEHSGCGGDLNRVAHDWKTELTS